MARINWKLLFFVGAATIGKTVETQHHKDLTHASLEHTIMLDEPRGFETALESSLTSQGVLFLDEWKPQTIDIEPVSISPRFYNSPFRTIQEQESIVDTPLNLDSWLVLQETGRLGEEKYFQEQKAMGEVDSLRQLIATKKLPRSQRKEIEEKILSKADYYGRVATQWKYRKSYDSRLTKKRIKKYNLDWIDCTKSVFEDFTAASKDSTILKDYLAHVGKKEYLTIFPKKTAEYLHENGYELIYVAVDTKAAKWKNRYWAGGKHRTHARPFYKKLLKGEYYAPIDYVVKDERVYSLAFKKFIEETPALLFLEEFIHMGTLHDGNMTDTKWNANIFDRENFARRNLYDLLTIEQEDTKDNVRQAVMVVAKGSVAHYNKQYTQK